MWFHNTWIWIANITGNKILGDPGAVIHNIYYKPFGDLHIKLYNYEEIASFSSKTAEILDNRKYSLRDRKLLRPNLSRNSFI